MLTDEEKAAARRATFFGVHYDGRRTPEGDEL